MGSLASAVPESPWLLLIWRVTLGSMVASSHFWIRKVHPLRLLLNMTRHLLPPVLLLRRSPQPCHLPRPPLCKRRPPPQYRKAQNLRLTFRRNRSPALSMENPPSVQHFAEPRSMPRTAGRIPDTSQYQEMWMTTFANWSQISTSAHNSGKDPRHVPVPRNVDDDICKLVADIHLCPYSGKEVSSANSMSQQGRLKIERMEKELSALTSTAMSYKSLYAKSASQMAAEAMSAAESEAASSKKVRKTVIESSRRQVAAA